MFVAALDYSLLPQQLVNGLLLGSIYALIALGYTMVYGVLKLINFAHGEVFMLGAYTSLLTSWALGLGPTGSATGSNWLILLIMLLMSMTVCGIIGVFIEFFAYRPMRNQPRIAALITAIGVSLLLQYGGALVLPNSPPPSILQKVNPFQGSLEVSLSSGDPKLQATVSQARNEYEAADKAFAPYKADPYNVPAAAKPLRTAYQDAERKLKDVESKYDNSAVKIRVQKGQGIMLVTTLVLMGLLTYLVMFTKAGRGMRAASHDFDSASLMGVNVNRIVTFTFLIGSVLAGAGAMMNATFMGTSLTTFYGLPLGVKAFVAAVLGGIGNIPGAVVGGLLMGVAETMVVWGGYGDYRDAVAFVILIVVLLFRPGGILGSSKVEKV